MNFDYLAFLPEIILSAAGVLLMVVIPYTDRHYRSRTLGYAALAAIAISVIPVLIQWNALVETGPGLAFYDTIFRDQFAQFCKLLFLFASGAVILISIHYLEKDSLFYGEFFTLLLFATVGMCVMASSADLILTFLGLEILSISTYVLASFREREVRSTESAWKYFILGAFSTAFLLYGIAFVYGATGSTKYLQIAGRLSLNQDYPLTLLLGLGLIIVGFGFKAALAPFQVWTPDVYEGAPVPITAHLAVGSKAAAFVAFLRVLYQVLPDLSADWQLILWASAALTMFVGNVAALTQSNIKRMLAYSSIAHAGYLLVGLNANNKLGAESVLFYLIAYALMTLGAFAVVQAYGRLNERYVNINDYSGMGYRNPFLSISLSVFLISMAGIPATAGFMGKLFLFAAAIESEMYALVILGLIASAIGVYYYLRVIVLMYMQHPEGEAATGLTLPMAVRIAIVIMLIGTFYLGLYPGPFLSLASEASNF
ncbi:MAG: NADH-quinone oxidoreductase subunit N [Acidobacteriota bacterium]